MLKVFFFNSFKFLKIFNFIHKFATKTKTRQLRPHLNIINNLIIKFLILKPITNIPFF